MLRKRPYQILKPSQLALLDVKEQNHPHPIFTAELSRPTEESSLSLLVKVGKKLSSTQFQECLKTLFPKLTHIIAGAVLMNPNLAQP